MKKAALTLIISRAVLLSLGSIFRVPAQTLQETAHTTRRLSLTKPAATDSAPKCLTQPAATQTPRNNLPGLSPTVELITSLTLAPQLTPSRQWLYHPPEELDVPVLLYLHVAASDKPKRDAVPPENFEAQISSLYFWGYTAIPLSLLS
jgi:hypothetical protein